MTGSGTEGNPYIGEVRRGRDIGFLSVSHKWVWSACLDCGKERWVLLRKGEPNSIRCISCATKRYGKTITGENSPKWKGGKARAIANYNRRLKLDVLRAYGGEPPKCACCGEYHIEFLTLDHINGGGNKERREKSSNLYSYLRVRGYPDGYRVLCSNCNFALAYSGYCPHNKEEAKKL